MGESAATLVEAGKLQSRLCRENGSPTYAAIIDEIVCCMETGDLDGRECAAVELLRADGRSPEQTAVFLRLLAAVHRRVLVDQEHPLRPYFPSVGGEVDTEAVVPVFCDAVAAEVAGIAAGMQANVQTNEVGRSAPLSAGLNVVGGRDDAPLRLLEVGASAGLNLWPDRYRVDADTVAWGPVDSPLKLTKHFASGSPPSAGFRVVERRGCDQHPLDISVGSNRTLLRSFVWPEHRDRLDRLDGALAAADPIEIDRSGAAEWIGARLRELPAGMTTVVLHSIVWPYLTEPERSAFTATVEAAAERADSRSRLAWLSLEPTDSYDEVRLRLHRWPEGEDVVLATSSPHGTSIRWSGPGSD